VYSSTGDGGETQLVKPVALKPVGDTVECIRRLQPVFVVGRAKGMALVATHRIRVRVQIVGYIDAEGDTVDLLCEPDRYGRTVIACELDTSVQWVTLVVKPNLCLRSYSEASDLNRIVRVVPVKGNFWDQLVPVDRSRYRLDVARTKRSDL